MPFQTNSLRLMLDVAKATETIADRQKGAPGFWGTPPNTTHKDELYRLAGEYLRRSGTKELIMAGLPAGRMIDNIAQVLDGYGVVSQNLHTVRYVGFECEKDVHTRQTELYQDIDTDLLQTLLIHGDIIEDLARSATAGLGANLLDFDLIANLWSSSGMETVRRIVAATRNCTKPGSKIVVLLNDCHRGKCGRPRDEFRELGPKLDRAWTDAGFKIIEPGHAMYSGSAPGQTGGKIRNTKWWWWLEVPGLLVISPAQVRAKIQTETQQPPLSKQGPKASSVWDQEKLRAALRKIKTDSGFTHPELADELQLGFKNNNTKTSMISNYLRGYLPIPDKMAVKLMGYTTDCLTKSGLENITVDDETGEQVREDDDTPD